MTRTTGSSRTTTDPAGVAQTAADQGAPTQAAPTQTTHAQTAHTQTTRAQTAPSQTAPTQSPLVQTAPADAAPVGSDEEALAAARSLAPLVSPEDAAAHLAAGGLLLDVRSAAGRATTGAIDGARVTDRADLGPELDPTASPSVLAAAGAAAGDGARLPVSLDTPIVVVCGSERGSGPVAAELIARGYTDVRQVDGGAPGWAAAGLPLTR